MTSLSLARRSLQTRLALAYAAGIYAAGILVVVVVNLPLAGIEASVPVDRPLPGVPTEPEPAIGPPPVLVGSSVALVLLLPTALALGWFVAGRFLRPLRAITATAKIISAGDLHRRLDLGRPTDELTELGGTLDDLFARLEASFDAQRHFVAGASHELLTPLAGQRTLLEVALTDPAADTRSLRAACQEVLDLGRHQELLIRALLALATGERGATRWEALDLAQVVEGVFASRSEWVEESGLVVTEHLTPAGTAGDPRLIESLVANLIDNAIRHNHPGGWVMITTQQHPTETTLSVTNSGPIIPDQQIERLFQPFEKLAPDRRGRNDGHGLGLAIVGAVAQAHHATIACSARPEGGLSVTVRFGATRVEAQNRPGSPTRS